MAMMSEEAVPLPVLESWLGSALDVVVHQIKRPDGSRVVSEIAVVGTEREHLLTEVVYRDGEPRLRPELPGFFQEKIGTERSAALMRTGGTRRP